MNLRRQAGISLIELMLAMLVLSIGLLGVAGLQSTTIRNSYSSQQRSVAITLATSMGERILASASSVGNGAFVLSKSCAVPALGGGIVSAEVHAWLTEIKSSLGHVADSSTCGQITYDAPSRSYTISVFWDDSRAVGGSVDTRYSYMVRL